MKYPPAGRSRYFIGSFADVSHQGMILLRGTLDAAAVERLREHIDGLLADSARFLIIDAHGVDAYSSDLLDVLASTQRRLGARRGMVQVYGLRPNRQGTPVGAVVGRPEHRRRHAHRRPDADDRQRVIKLATAGPA